MRKRFGRSALLGLALAVLVRAPAPAARKPAERGDALIAKLRSSSGVPAVSGAVAWRGEIVYSGGAGWADVERRVPAKGASVYNIGSVSKAITAIAVMQLVEAGRVRLDDDVRKYVPEFPDKGATVTVRHLLTHTSGIRHYLPTDFPGTPDNENVDPAFDWRRGIALFASDPLLFRPGAYFFYTSYGVNLLQGVVEKASGEGFEAYVRTHVFRPAGMTLSGFDAPDLDGPGRARPYRLVGGKPVPYYPNDLRYKDASGAMTASVEDLVRLGAAMNHDRLVRPATRSVMFSDQDRGLRAFRRGKPPGAIGFVQGMLWRLRRDRERRFVAYECGSVRGSNACVVDFVDEDLVAAVASNAEACCGWKPADALAAVFRKVPAAGLSRGR